MKIAFITTDARDAFKKYDLEFPCFGTAPQALLEGFKKIPDIEIHVISCSRRAMNSTNKLAENIYFHQPVVSPYGWGRTLFSGCILAARSLVRQIKPDIVHGQGTERDCAISSVLCGSPNVITLHGNMRIHGRRPEHRKSHYYRMVSFLESIAVRHTNGIVAISNFTHDLVRKDCKQSIVIPNAVDEMFFSASKACNAIPRLLVVGAIAPHKNTNALIKICEPLLREGKFMIAIAGDVVRSEYGKTFFNLVKDIPNIRHLGFLTRGELYREIELSDAIIHPTLEDNCPMVILEAMAAGRPVAASAIGGIPDLVDHGVTGYIFDPNNPDDILKCIDDLITNQKQREVMGLASQTKAKSHYQSEIVARNHLKFYQRIIH